MVMSANASSKNPVFVPDHKKAELKRLTRAPAIAWPTLAVAIWVVGGVIMIDYLALTGAIPLWAAMLLNVLFMYPVFHVAHDSLHRAASSNRWFNDKLGSLVLLFTIPEVSLGVFRYSHMQHHRFTNDDKDPDHYVDGSNWVSTIFRWMTFELYYVYYNLTSSDPRGLKAVKSGLPMAVGTVVVYALLCYLGYWKEATLLWLIPSRIAITMIGGVFLWLPHVSEAADGGIEHMHSSNSSRDNLTAGTTMRVGSERILNVLCQWHNHHLIHHLWPTTPAYNHGKVWQLLEPELRSRDLNIQHNFDLLPTFSTGSASQVAS
jgi:beta-carotene hydroxylase